MNLKTSEQKESSKIFNSIFITMFIVNMLVHLSFYMMSILSPIYADVLGAPATIVGFISSLFALTALFFRFIAGPVIDTYNRKNILIGSILILFFSYVGYSLSHTILMLIISRLLTGIGLAFGNTLILTIASDSLPIKKMGTGIGFFSLGIAGCNALAPALALKLSETLGYTPAFMINAGLMILTIGCVLTMKLSIIRVKQFNMNLDNIIAKEILIPTFLLFFLAMTGHTINTFLVLFSEHQGISSNIGYYFTVSAIAMLITRPLIGKLSDRHGIVLAIIPSMVCFAGAILLISLSKTLIMFLIAGVLSAFGFGGCQPALFALCMKSVPKERRGAASSTSFMGIDLGSLIGPIFAGFLVEKTGYVRMWQIMIIPIFFIVLISIIFRNNIDKPNLFSKQIPEEV
jgi:MFS family permease